MNSQTYIVRTRHTGVYSGRFISPIYVEATTELEAARIRFAR